MGGGSDTITPEAEKPKAGLDIVTIGIYTGGVFCAIIIILVVVMIVEKVRRKRKRITEVVEL